ncbi:unnamed protein product [Periconia digitata]|uniref:Zn(2)-C6 fungal-type domain-containing protein n=1 Tax=Periconia digitata TaxID=1303443 RepID=A0A9W4UF37_9PLEO|nr:unnamed protein product [Periconia digitata]
MELDGPSDPSATRHKKLIVSCQRCRDGRLKCDKGQPACSNCLKAGFTCNPAQILPRKRIRTAQTSNKSENVLSGQSLWTDEEDGLIIELRGQGYRWDLIAEHLPGKSVDDCRIRYQNHHRPLGPGFESPSYPTRSNESPSSETMGLFHCEEPPNRPPSRTSSCASYGSANSGASHPPRMSNHRPKKIVGVSYNSLASGFHSTAQGNSKSRTESWAESSSKATPRAPETNVFGEPWFADPSLQNRSDHVEAPYFGAHERRHSIKKPTSFMAVSVTKQFLATSSASKPAVEAESKASTQEKTSSSYSKPRLIAKAPERTTTSPWLDTSEASSHHPPPLKHFTDENLIKLYEAAIAGDKNSKKATWAEIEDDDDDWAPDILQWMDGTATAKFSSSTDNPKPPHDEHL